MPTETVGLRMRMAVAMMLPDPDERTRKSAEPVKAEPTVEELLRTVRETLKGYEMTIEKDVKTVDSENAESWSAEALQALIAVALHEIEANRLTCLEAARRVLSEIPGCTPHIERFEEASRRRIGAEELARLIADASEAGSPKPAAPGGPRDNASKSEEPTEAELSRKSIEVLDEAWETSERALKSAGKSIAKTYYAYDRALTSVLSLKVPAELAAIGILKVAQQELEA